MHIKNWPPDQLPLLRSVIALLGGKTTMEGIKVVFFVYHNQSYLTIGQHWETKMDYPKKGIESDAPYFVL